MSDQGLRAEPVSDTAFEKRCDNLAAMLTREELRGALYATALIQGYESGELRGRLIAEQERRRRTKQ